MYVWGGLCLGCDWVVCVQSVSEWVGCVLGVSVLYEWVLMCVCVDVSVPVV